MQEARPGAASPEHLTIVLRRAGVLSEGRVKSVVVESSRQMLVSRVMRLRLEVDGQDGTAPASVFFMSSTLWALPVICTETIWGFVYE